jgi:hypothetical protein
MYHSRFQSAFGCARRFFALSTVSTFALCTIVTITAIQPNDAQAQFVRKKHEENFMPKDGSKSYDGGDSSKKKAVPDIMNNNELAPGFEPASAAGATGPAAAASAAAAAGSVGDNTSNDDSQPSGFSQGTGASAEGEASRNKSMTDIIEKMRSGAAPEVPRLSGFTPTPPSSAANNDYDKEPAPVRTTEDKAIAAVPAAPALPDLFTPEAPKTPDVTIAAAEKPAAKKVAAKKKYVPAHDFHTQHLPDTIYKDSYVNRDNSYLPTTLRWSQLNSEMLKAARSGDLQGMRALAKRGISIDTKNQFGDSLLSIAARHGQTHIVHWLVVRGAKVNVVDAQGQTPLHTATALGNEAMVRALLDAGANPNQNNQQGIIAAQYARSERVSSLLRAYGSL